MFIQVDQVKDLFIIKNQNNNHKTSSFFYGVKNTSDFTLGTSLSVSILTIF